MAAEIRSARRFYLLKRRAAEALLEPLWQAKQEAEPGTALPADFPQLGRLQGCGYTTVDDLDGADECELTDLGFTSAEAAAVLVALAPLL